MNTNNYIFIKLHDTRRQFVSVIHFLTVICMKNIYFADKLQYFHIYFKRINIGLKPKKIWMTTMK